MNCKPGDLAIVVHSHNNNHGRIVQCIRLVDFSFQLGEFSSWMTEPMLMNSQGVLVPIPDYQLRPIRDPGEDAQDETLQWLPVPSVQKEAA